MNRDYTKKTSAYLNSFLEKEGYRLLHTEFVEEDHSFYLRVYIDLTEAEFARREALRKQKAEEAETALAEKADGSVQAFKQDGQEEEEPEKALSEDGGETEEISAIGINDCAQVSRRLSKWLDQEDFIREAYTLEVCSRGFLKNE